jgi:hypothetical protein
LGRDGWLAAVDPNNDAGAIAAASNTMTHSSYPASEVSVSWRWALATLLYHVTVCLAHLQFSLWLVRGRDTFLGRMAFSDLVPAVAVATSLALLGWIAWQLRRSARPGLTAGMWLLCLASAVMIDQWLTFSTNEYAHYPQYALLACLLARTIDPHRRLHHTVPQFRHDGGIAPERLTLSQQCKAHRPAPSLQMARDDKAVAAIIAGPAEDQHRPRPVAPDNLVRHGAAGILHEREG